MSHIIDLRPLIDQVVMPFVETALVPVVGIVVTKATQFLHVKVTEAQAQKVEGAIWNGIHFALGKAQEEADKYAQVTSKSTLVATAANYVIPKVPNAIKSLKMTDKGLQDRIFARLSAMEQEAKVKPE